MRATLAFAVLSASLVVSFAGAPARADSADFDELSAPDADVAQLAGRLEGIARKLRAGLDVTRKGPLTILSPGSDSEREAIADRLTKEWTGAASWLRSLGFAAAENPPESTFIVVRVHGAPSASVRAPSSGVLVLLRQGDLARAPEPAGVVPRADGPAIRRDGVAAARSSRLWRADVAAAAVARSGETYAIARQVVAATVGRDAVPPWFYEGLISWVETASSSGAAPGHFCKAFATPSPALLARILDDGSVSSPVVARFLGRFVGALVDGKADLPRRLTELKRAGGAPEKAIETAFGVAALAALATACDGLKDAAGTCDEKGTIACPACKGACRIELACADCLGTGGLACPSCGGYERCPAGCEGGYVTYVGGKKVKCKVCSAGKLKCQACAGAMRAQCKSCGGSGKASWPCLGCAGTGRVTCPESGAAADAAGGAACPWCSDSSRPSACPDCAGVGYLGCDACGGTLRQVCGECGGTGEIRMVYSDGTAASSSKCGVCEGRGWFRCSDCKNGRSDCLRCGGKGRGRFSPSPGTKSSDCPGCDAGVLPSIEDLRSAEATAGSALGSEEAAENQKMQERAVAFLLTCNRTASGAFALREFRQKGSATAGALEKPTLFSNADVLWTLVVVGVDRNDPRLAKAWEVLREQAGEIVAGTAEYSGTQACAQAVRALAAGGEDPKGALLRGLVDKLVKGQHASGWWGDSLDGKDEDEALDSLMAVEALRVARVKGAKVSRAVWQKILRAASSEFDGKGPAGMKSGFMTATEVLSNMALVVMAKEGSLGAKATAFDYTTLPAIKKGLAWLDRFFDIRKEPAFVKGAVYRKSSDAGYSAYLFAVERLAMLLNIEVLAGERWHVTGARHLRTIQFKDGSFEETSPAHLNGPVRTTTSCVLFIARATMPVTDVDDGE